MFAKMKKTAKDLGLIAAICVGLLFLVVLVFGSVAFEALKFFALVKYLFS